MSNINIFRPFNFEEFIGNEKIEDEIVYNVHNYQREATSSDIEKQMWDRFKLVGYKVSKADNNSDTVSQAVANANKAKEEEEARVAKAQAEKDKDDADREDWNIKNVIH